MIVENRFRNWIGILAAIFLGITFIVAGSGKLLTPVVEAEIPKAFLVILIIIELGIGIFLVTGVLVKPVASFSLFLIACFIISNILMKMLGMEECLSCFGAMGKLSTTQALMIDGVMMALAVTILAFYPGRFFNKRPWFWGK